MNFRELHLWFLGDPARPLYAGALSRPATSPGVALRYGQDWLQTGFALSEDLPLRDQLFLPPPRQQASVPVAVGAVDDARPDHWGERVIEWVLNPGRNTLLEHLYFAGDDRLGALGVSTSASEYAPAPRGPLPGIDRAQSISEVAARIEEGPPISELEAQVIRGGGSLGGAKPKALVQIDGAPWILKFNAQGSNVDTSLIEHATMTLAAKAGLDVALTQAVRLVDGHAIAVRRFDRMENGYRLHTMSAGTVLRAANVAPVDFGYPEFAQLLRRQGAPKSMDSDAAELFRRMVFNILMDNTDDHEKNHAALALDPWAHGSLKLAPAYDVLPSMSGQVHQQFRCGALGAESTLANAMSLCEDFGLAAQEAASDVARLIGVVQGWEAHFKACGVTEPDMKTLQAWLNSGEKLHERDNFSQADHSRTRLPKRRNPFAPG
jgi:serine/threonine-protein kinase HipA